MKRLDSDSAIISSQSFSTNNAWKFISQCKICQMARAMHRISLTPKKLPRAFSWTLHFSSMYFVEKDSKDKLLRWPVGKKMAPSFVYFFEKRLQLLLVLPMGHL